MIITGISLGLGVLTAISIILMLSGFRMQRELLKVRVFRNFDELLRTAWMISLVVLIGILSYLGCILLLEPNGIPATRLLICTIMALIFYAGLKIYFMLRA